MRYSVRFFEMWSNEMLNFKWMRFTVEVILVCIRWYAACSQSSRNLEVMMEERGALTSP